MNRAIYFRTYATLLLLLLLTVVVGKLPLGPLHLPATILVAAMKASLVGYIFMHLREANGVTRLFVGVSLLWLIFLLGLTLTEATTRAWIS